MEFRDVVKRRRMVRHFSTEPVSHDALVRIVDAGSRGPSAGNSQGHDFVIVTEAGTRARIAALCGEQGYVRQGFDPFLSEAPVHIVPCIREATYHERYQESDKVNDDGTEIEWPVPFWVMDGGAAVMLVLLAAVDEGLATAFVGTWELDGLRSELGIPADVTPLGVIALGHAAREKRSV
ncbi:MAG: nitroreductase family protein [Pseudomonadales bacterium]|nr:nitroreductase family protein [Pseudomonadales bacterium]